MILIRRAGLLGAAFALAWLAGCGGSSGGGSGPPARNAYVAVPQGNAIAAFRVNIGSGDLNPRAGFAFRRWDLSGGDCRPSFGQVCLYRQPGRQ